MPMTPEQWQILQMLAAEVAKSVAANIRDQPPKEFKVHRSDPSGATFNETKSMPQMMAELCDEMRKTREVQQAHVKAIRGLEKAIKEKLL